MRRIQLVLAPEPVIFSCLFEYTPLARQAESEAGMQHACRLAACVTQFAWLQYVPQAAAGSILCVLVSFFLLCFFFLVLSKPKGTDRHILHG